MRAGSYSGITKSQLQSASLNTLQSEAASSMQFVFMFNWWSIKKSFISYILTYAGAVSLIKPVASLLL